MQQPGSFETVGTRGFFRPAGTMTLERAVQLTSEAIAFACHERLVDLVLDTRGLVGFEAPDVFERFFMVSDWAKIAGGVPIRMALVARQEVIDHRKFGVTVATNRGLWVDIFATEEEAVAWLDSPGSTRKA